MNRRLLVILSLLCGAPAYAVDEALAWREAFELNLPEPTRSIVLRAQTDAQAWLVDHALEQARVLSRNAQGSIIEVAMSDAQWLAAQDGLCTASAVTACETVVCQAVQLTGEATPGPGQSAEAIQARLVRNPPELVPVPDEADGEAGSCQGPPLIPPLAPAEGAAGIGDLTLDLSIIDRDSSDGRSGEPSAGQEPSAVREPSADQEPSAGEEPSADQEPSAGEEPSADQEPSARQEQTATTRERQSFEFSLASAFSAAGGVTFSTDSLPADTSDWTMVVGAACSEVSVPLDAIEPARAPGLVVALVSQGTAAAVAGTYALTVVREISLDSTGETLAVFATADNIATVIAALALDARVTGAQPEFIYRTTAEFGQSSALSTVTYSDPYAALTYGPQQTGALDLHSAASGKGLLIAVIDTGVDVDHPDLTDRVQYEDLTDKGWSADAHGTAVAGIIAAAADNAIGSYGVAPGAEILALKACQPKQEGGLSARCWTSTLVKALDVAMQKDAAIINMSLAGPPDALLAKYVALALQQDRLIVAGAGNGGPHAKPGFPAALPGVIAVTAVDVWDRHYKRANLGAYIDLAAPGVDIIAPAPNGEYPPLSGTSMAAAHVTGVAALLKELVPGMSATELVSVLQNNVRDLGEPGKDSRYGNGLLDACAAARLATADAALCAGRAAQGGDDDAQNSD